MPALRPRIEGFTLLEVLVVLILIGIIVTFAAASLRGPDAAARVQQEAARAQALLQLASDEAVMRARIYGVQIRADGYTFVARGPDGWHTVNEKPLQPRALPAGIRLPAPADSEDQAPQILLLADGTFSPFALRFRDPQSGTQQIVQGTADGRIEVLQP